MNRFLLVFTILLTFSAQAEIIEHTVSPTSNISCTNDVVTIDEVKIVDISSLFMNENDCLTLSNIVREKGYLAVDSKAIDDTLSAFLQFNKNYIRPNGATNLNGIDSNSDFDPYNVSQDHLITKILEQEDMKQYYGDELLFAKSGLEILKIGSIIYKKLKVNRTCFVLEIIPAQVQCKFIISTKVKYSAERGYSESAVIFKLRLDEKGEIIIFNHMQAG